MPGGAGEGGRREGCGWQEGSEANAIFALECLLDA